MAKSKASNGYQVVGKTSDGIEVLKPKMSSGHLRELRATAKKMMAARRQQKATTTTAADAKSSANARKAGRK